MLMSALPRRRRPYFGELTLIHEVTVYVPWLGACLAVFVLIAATAIFVLRLYLVESRVDKQWRDCDEFLFLCKSAGDEAVTPDEAWWRAEQSGHEHIEGAEDHILAIQDHSLYR